MEHIDIQTTAAIFTMPRAVQHLPVAGGQAPTDLPATAWLLSDGRAGHEAQALGIVEALGVSADIRRVAPRALYACLAPFGPIDPSEAPDRDGSPIAPPFPDLVIAAGRRTLPYLREIKRASQGQTYTVYVNAPATGPGAADLIVAPRHDSLFARNVVAPLTPANCVTPARLQRLREAPDARVAALPGPRVALLIGGDSRHFKFTGADATALTDIVHVLVAQGVSVMATASRRTPDAVVRAVLEALEGTPGFLWDGAGDNPYFSMLANADAIIVTADSVNMVGEAAATGAPVHVFAPSGGHPKITAYLHGLEAAGAVRPWRSRLEDWRYEPINSTPMIADAIAQGYVASCAAARQSALRRGA